MCLERIFHSSKRRSREEEPRLLMNITGPTNAPGLLVLPAPGNNQLGLRGGPGSISQLCKKLGYLNPSLSLMPSHSLNLHSFQWNKEYEFIYNDIVLLSQTIKSQNAFSF